MRYSPYAMEDYALQHREGSLSLFRMTAYDEAAWNLYWAAIPKLDALLDMPFEDFDRFRVFSTEFPFIIKIKCDEVLARVPELRHELGSAEPKDALGTLHTHMSAVYETLGPLSLTWLEIVAGRLALAQSLVDVKEAAAICKAVVAVDFKAGRRL